MNRTTLSITLIGITLIIGAFAFVLLRPGADQTIDTTTSPTPTPQPRSSDSATTTPAPLATPGAYITYTEQSIATTPGTKILFFHAPWCSQCREIEASIEQGGVPDGVTILKVDYDSNQQLRQQYGVTLQTTFIKVDDNGKKIASYVAYDEPEFSAVQRALLP